MPRPLFAFALTAGIAMSLALPLISLASLAAPKGDGPFLVMVLPFAGGADEIIRRAGGERIGPLSTRFAAVSAHAPASALMAAGAFAVHSVAALPFLCTTELDE